MYIIMCMEAVYTISNIFISTHINNNAIIIIFSFHVILRQLIFIFFPDIIRRWIFNLSHAHIIGYLLLVLSCKLEISSF